MEKSGRQGGTVPPFRFDNDLRQHHRGEVLAGRHVRYHDFLAPPDHLRHFVQGDVATCLGVIKLPVGIALECIGHTAKPSFPASELPLKISRQERLGISRSEEHTSELQSRSDLVCRLLLEKKINVAVPPACEATKLAQPCPV